MSEKISLDSSVFVHNFLLDINSIFKSIFLKPDISY